MAEPISRRRIAFRACAAMLGYSLYEVAARCGVTYNHLMLVLDGVRQPSARLAAAINDVLREGRPILLEELTDAGW